MPNRLADLPARPEPSTIILLASLGPLREAIHRAQEALRQNGQVIFVCFRKDIADFLRPLASDRVEIHLHEETLTFTTSQWLAEIKALRTFHRKLESLYGQLEDAKVWGYASSISLASIVAFNFFTRRYNFYYTGVYEGRDAKDGIFYQPTARWRRRLKAALLSALVGSEIKFVRDWSPVPVLSQKFVEKRTLPAPDWEVTTPRCLLEKRLLRPCSQQILLLFTNYSDYYRAGINDGAKFDDFCGVLGRLLRETAGDGGVAVKPHPTCAKLPDDWGWMEQIAPGFPLEFIDFHEVRLIVGDASTSMISPLLLNQMPVISYAHLLTTSWASQVRTYLDERVDMKGAIHRPKAWDDFEALVAGACSERLTTS